MENILKINNDIKDSTYNIDFNKILKLTDLNTNTIKNADSILNNQIILQESLDTISFPKKIDWDYKHKVSSNTYQLYLHSLMPISFLANAYEKTYNRNYLYKAQSILEEWIKYESTEHKNNFPWYDHSTAYRTLNLIYLYLCLIKEEMNYPLLDSLIIKHAEYLYSDKHYRKNNHGVMMDRSLIQLGVVFNHTSSQNWINKGVFRLKDNFYNNYSSRGIHLENSPEYHHVVEKLFLSIEDFLKKYDMSLGPDIINKFELINDYYNYIVKPDGFLPLIGDSSKKKFNSINKKFSSIVDRDAGISILQAKNIKNLTESTWMSFVCGYSTLTHKHYDDLSLTLFYKGNDIFVDSGKHSYGSSPARGYVRSAKAHNTIVINDKNYKHLSPKEAKSKITITDFVTNDIYDFVKGKNESYENISIHRSILFFKPDICILLDQIKSEKKVKISQIFNLDPKITIIRKDITKTVLKTPNSNISIEQLNGTDQLLLHKGDLNKPYAVISEQFSKLIETSQLEYITEGDNIYFLSVIKMGKGQERISDIKFNSFSRLLEANVDGQYFSVVL